MTSWSFCCLVVVCGALAGGLEMSRVEVDLEGGLVTGYSDRVRFLSTPGVASGSAKRCARQAVVRVDLGGKIQIAKVELEFGHPQLWTFHLSDTLLADGYGDVFTHSSQGAATSDGVATTEMFVLNHQLRVYTNMPQAPIDSGSPSPSVSSDLPTSSPLWSFLQVVDDTVQKRGHVELTLDLREYSIRWQDGRLAHDFHAPPGLFPEEQERTNSSVIYIAMNRILAGDWRRGSGLCRVTLRLLDNDEDQCNGAHIDCDPNAVCKHSRRFFRCSCRDGWEGDGKTCKDVDECRLRNGGCVQLCRNLPGSYACACLRGFTTDPRDPSNCLDIDECASADHGCEHHCVNTVGSYECRCPREQMTTPHRHCQHEESPCQRQGCQHTCLVGLYGNVQKCSCWSDYQLNSTDAKSCIRKCRLGNGGCQHHCLDTEAGPVCTCQHKYLLGLDGRKCTASCCVNNGGCQKRCSNTDVGVTCGCPGGYLLNSDNTTCTDIDECATNNGGCQHQCLNTVGSYECVCPDGYKLDPVDEKTCLDIDECTLNTTCGHTCVNTAGSYACTCNDGFRLFGVAHCGDIDECFVANGGCPEDCVNTVGSFLCTSKNVNITKSKDSSMCKSNISEGLDFTRAKFLIAGLPCSEINSWKIYSNELIDQLGLNVIHSCKIQVINMKCVDADKLKYKIDLIGKDLVKVALRVVCHPGKRMECGLKNCTLASTEDGVQRLKDSLNQDGISIKIRNHDLMVVNNTFSMRRKSRKQKCEMVGRTQNSSQLLAIPTMKSNGHGTSRGNAIREKFRTTSGWCPLGSVWSEESYRCEECDKGTYRDSLEDNFCVKCPGNSTTDSRGATDVNFCKRLECTSYINDLNGFIESPNYPGPYPDNVDCKWFINPPKGRRLLIIVPEIHLAGDKCEDYLVMKKSKSAYSAITFEACKSVDRPLAFVAQSRRLWISFKSDGKNSSKGFHIPFVTYNEDYQSLMEDIVQDRRLYSSQKHLEILRDMKLLDALMEVIAQPINYYKYSNDQRKMFPSSFLRLMTPKVRKFFSYRR